VLAPNLIGMIDVIAIPRLTRFFGTRLLHFGACAAAKACYEKSKRADNFQAGEYVFHIFIVPDKLWISSHEICAACTTATRNQTRRSAV
jgi:hypothetical protein